MNFDILDSREVYWAVTNQYEIRFEDGEIMEFRAAEDDNGTDFYVLTDDGWESLEEDNKYHDAFYEAWSEGTLS
jgi:hypothetical protein